MLQISFSSDIRPVGGSLAILVPQGETRPAVFTELDTALSGALSRAAKADKVARAASSTHALP